MSRHYGFIGTQAEIKAVQFFMPIYSGNIVLQNEKINTILDKKLNVVELWAYKLSAPKGHGVYLDESVKLSGYLMPHLAYIMLQNGNIAWDYEGKSCSYDNPHQSGLSYCTNTYDDYIRLTIEQIEERTGNAIKCIKYLGTRYGGKHHLYAVKDELCKFHDCLFLDIAEMKQWLDTRRTELDVENININNVNWWQRFSATHVNTVLLAMINESLK